MRRFRVLIVDDSSVMRDAIANWFASIPEVSRIAVAASGDEALAAWVPGQADLVVTDIQMPGMDGFEFARRLRATPEAPRVVVMSLSDSPDYDELARRAGAELFIRKRELYAALARYVYSTFAGDAAWLTQGSAG